MLDTVKTTAFDSANPYQTAYEATSADRTALSPNDLVPVNTDIPSAVTTILGVVSRLSSLREEIAAKLPSDVGQVDKVTTYAHALSHAHSVYYAASAPFEPLPELAEQATKCRDVLLADAKALAIHGLVDPKPLAELKGGPGYLNIATDLSVLARIFRERWPAIVGVTPLTPSNIEEAERIFQQINQAYGERTQQPAEVAKVTEDRQRAFTLLVRTYDQVRKLTTYVRWEKGDADKIAPSLWANRGRSGMSSASNKTEPASAEPAPNAAPTATATPIPTPPVAPAGHPGSSPFAEN